MANAPQMSTSALKALTRTGVALCPLGFTKTCACATPQHATNINAQTATIRCFIISVRPSSHLYSSYKTFGLSSHSRTVWRRTGVANVITRVKTPSRASRRVRRVCAVLVASGLVWLTYTAARSKILLANGRAIEVQSASFSRDYFVGDERAPTLKYLVMGDSTAAGWGTENVSATYPYLVAQSVARRGYRVQVINVAVGGARATDVRRNQLEALGLKPDLITLSVGANDATHFTAPASFRREMERILTALRNSGARRVLVADTPDMFLAPALPRPLALGTARRARAQNAMLREIGAGVVIVPLYEAGKLDSRREAGLYAADRFHPSAMGYARWARVFVENLGAL